MNETITNYLSQLNKQLRQLKIADRLDILEEVESHIFEAVANDAPLDQILHALGDPKKLAECYANEASLKSSSFNLRNLVQLVKFYFITGFSGIIIIPTIGIMAITFYLTSFLVVIGGAVKTVGLFFGYRLPIVILNFGFWEAPDFMALPVCLVVGLLLYVSSKKLWSLLKSYLFSISTTHRKLQRQRL